MNPLHSSWIYQDFFLSLIPLSSCVVSYHLLRWRSLQNISLESLNTILLFRQGGLHWAKWFPPPLSSSSNQSWAHCLCITPSSCETRGQQTRCEIQTQVLYIASQNTNQPSLIIHEEIYVGFCQRCGKLQIMWELKKYPFQLALHTLVCIDREGRIECSSLPNKV